MTSTNTVFARNDSVHILPNLAGADEFTGRIGTVVGFEHADRVWVIVRFDRFFSGRPDGGWLFSAGALTHATAQQAAA
jgi:hypothetical protein